MDNKTLCRCGHTWGEHLIDPPHGLSPYAPDLPYCARFKPARLVSSPLARLILVMEFMAAAGALSWMFVAFIVAEANVWAWSENLRGIVAWSVFSTGVFALFFTKEAE